MHCSIVKKFFCLSKIKMFKKMLTLNSFWDCNFHCTQMYEDWTKILKAYCTATGGFVQDGRWSTYSFTISSCTQQRENRFYFAWLWYKGNFYRSVKLVTIIVYNVVFGAAIFFELHKTKMLLIFICTFTDFHKFCTVEFFSRQSF